MPERRRDPGRPWCVIAWIVWHPVARAAPLTPGAHLMHLAGSGAIQPASDPQKARIAAEIDTVNQIFGACGTSFKVCETILLDTSRVTWGPPAAPRRLSDLFTNAGLFDRATANFPESLRDVMTNGGPPEFVERMRKRCIHLFFAHQVTDSSDPEEERGFGGTFAFGSAVVSHAMVETGDRLAQVMAHEIAHALGEGHSTKPGNLMLKRMGVNDTRLEEDPQCQRIRAHLAAHIDPACP